MASDTHHQTDRQLPPLITRELKQTTTSKIAEWFSGESTFAIPSPTRETMPVEPPTERPRNTLISRFSLFGTKPTPKSPLTTHDEWHELDVKSALIPGSADPFSPSSFKNLQQNAEGLLLKLQTAYKERSEALHDVLAEKEAQAEELEGAKTRTRHLKIQLDDMTAKLAEQDKAMMDLVDQLAQEKQARRESDYRKSRTSTASDVSCESEGSYADSLFSHGATSPMSMSSVSTLNSPESHRQTAIPSKRDGIKANETNGDSETWLLKLENTRLKGRIGELENTVDDCLDMVNGLF
ncbi:MAG: hypothetical protein Q9216_003189 [Gyalolechia sp. 2 TL-2023]